jgi:hypothetical protein
VSKLRSEFDAGAFSARTPFMHSRDAAPALKLIAAAGFFWLLILIGLGLADFAVRSMS